MKESLQLFLSGMVLMGLWACGYFFWRFWQSTRDKLFVYFALAFWILGVERIVLSVMRLQDEVRPSVFLIRLAAFALILTGIIHTNSKKS